MQGQPDALLGDRNRLAHRHAAILDLGHEQFQVVQPSPEQFGIAAGQRIPHDRRRAVQRVVAGELLEVVRASRIVAVGQRIGSKRLATIGGMQQGRPGTRRPQSVHAAASVKGDLRAQQPIGGRVRLA
jgi:hypothetical protein